jgi:hypothetical protein
VIVDDDIFMHMANLIEYHQELEQMGFQDFWIGHIHRGAAPIMNKISKYNLPMKSTSHHLPRLWGQQCLCHLQ